jgi:RNA polymerase sigma-70 factor (sigma-E family)
MPGPRPDVPPALPGDERDLRDDPGTWDAATAVTALYSAHWRPLVRLAALLTGDASVAEEVVQDAFVALYRRWSVLGDPGSALGYVRAAVVNGARSRVRHRLVEERHRQPAAPDPAGPEELAVRATEDARVLAALRTLPRRQQEVLVLRYYGDLSEEDIAGAIGVSRGSVKRHAFRGMATLRERLAAGAGAER